MSSELVLGLVGDLLTLSIILGWAVLIVAGIEPDMPLSGGIPGHVDPLNRANGAPEGVLGHVGEVGAWLLLAAISLSLPFVVLWITRVHG